jgi:hemerythrin
MALEKKYNTGVVWQDFQHQELMELFFKVKEAKVKNKGGDVFQYAVAFLAMYVNHHFKLEEEYMDIYYYKDAKAHKKEHKDLIKRLRVFRKKYSGYDDQAIDTLLVTLNNWILNHILGDDKKLGEYILDCEQKKS